MHAKPAMVRIGLIDECALGEQIGEALSSAGYNVTSEGEDVDVVVHVTSRRLQSGISGLGADNKTVPIDVMADRDLEAQLRQTQKMEAIAHLAGGIAHDFNNILSVISICADEVLDGMTPADPKRECVVDIRHAVERGSTVTRDLLSFSRRGIQELRLVDLNDLVIDYQGMLGRILGDDITLQTELAAFGACVRIDPGQWSSVFVNLAVNARYAMPDGGTLKLATREMTLDPAARGRDRPKGRYVELEVTDTGCGMTDDVEARIFEPFFTTKGAGKGAGLGLSVVHGVVEQSDGWIEVTSDVGRGTTFRLYLPVTPNAPAVTPDSRRSSVLTERNITLLLVEDEGALRRVAFRTLERSGYRVFQAPSAEEAMAMLEEIGTIDLLVTDIVLPGMDGRRFADILCERYENLRVLYTSGHTDDEVLRRGVSQREMCFLQKPYTTTLLLRRVDDVLGKAKQPRRGT